MYDENFSKDNEKFINHKCLLDRINIFIFSFNVCMLVTFLL